MNWIQAVFDSNQEPCYDLTQSHICTHSSLNSSSATGTTLLLLRQPHMDDPVPDAQPHMLRDRPRVTVRSEEPLPEPEPRRLIPGKLIFIFIVCLLGAAFLFGVWFEFVYDKKYKHDDYQNPNQLSASQFCTPDVTVSQNGDGNFSRISSAIKAAPNYSKSRFCIYVKAGRYTESVFVPPEKINVVIFGDGIGRTVITSNTSCDSGWCKYQTATLWVMGYRFRAVGLTVENTQVNKTVDALAVLNMGEESIFLRCSFTSFHTTLTAYSGRHFYRDCYIGGGGVLVDSWQAGARAVFQKCALQVSANSSTERKSVVAANARDTEIASGGLVFHLSNISVSGGTRATEPLLGLAMGAYARILYLMCQIQLQASWELGNFTKSTVLFGIYNISGVADSYNTSEVKVLDYAVASEFSVRNFLEDNFLVPWNVPCELDLV